jgi:hypothetical protein
MKLILRSFSLCSQLRLTSKLTYYLYGSDFDTNMMNQLNVMRKIKYY